MLILEINILIHSYWKLTSNYVCLCKVSNLLLESSWSSRRRQHEVKSSTACLRPHMSAYGAPLPASVCVGDPGELCCQPGNVLLQGPLLTAMRARVLWRKYNYTTTYSTNYLQFNVSVSTCVRSRGHQVFSTMDNN